MDGGLHGTVITKNRSHQKVRYDDSGVQMATLSARLRYVADGDRKNRIADLNDGKRCKKRISALL